MLGTADLAFTAIGIVIGSGIFLVPGLVHRQRGTNTLLALGVWTAGGLLTFFGALTYAELGAMRPRSRRHLYVYIRDAFGPLPAFLYGWSAFFVIATGSVATTRRRVLHLRRTADSDVARDGAHRVRRPHRHPGRPQCPRYPA
jgi:APA family basic amino acid/polyamine antiporter